MELDVAALREQFPILHQDIHGRPLVYLDNAASCQKPRRVIEAVRGCYEGYYANIHRGVHSLSERSTFEYEKARGKVKNFLNAASHKEIVFTRGTTEGINLVASSFGDAFVGQGDEILITALEHHSNIVPWQLLCQRRGAVLKVAPVDDRGQVMMEEFQKLLSPRTRLVAVVHVSNALGTINPVEAMIRLAHEREIPVLVDGAQSAPHLQVDVQALDCDFYTFSGHKVYGPSGVGVLYGKEKWLNAMPPYQGGGDMIKIVTFESTEYAELPAKFEAGTPNIAGVIGLGAALEWTEGVGLAAIAAHETRLLDYATERLGTLPGLRVIGTAERKASVLSFVMEDIHPHDIGTILDHQGVAIRTGHHCAQPLMRRFQVPATARASFAVYNTREEVDILYQALQKVQEMFG
ncbi:MAG: cysteine desulfurase [Candidatus Competibacteraceae bacterium]|nr:cysteine desulfurase [Candidatus Competibacteraceae bacterium]